MRAALRQPGYSSWRRTHHRGDRPSSYHHALLPPDLVIGHEDGWARIADQLEARLRAAGLSR
jgi:hypothetical protein